MENSKSEIMKTRIAVKKSHIRSQNSSATSTHKSVCDDTKSIIVSLKNTAYAKEIIRRKWISES